MNQKVHSNEEGGIIVNVILIVVVLIGLKYLFNFDVIAWLKSPKPQAVIQTVWTAIKTAYNWLDMTIKHLLQK